MKPQLELLSDSRKSYDSRQLSPKKSEWALLNQYKALQFERLKQRQRHLAQQKKNKFIRQLDRQLSSKNNVQQQEVQADRKYYEFIINQGQQQKQKQQRQKHDKFIKRKQTEQENNYRLQINRNSRMNDFDTGYHLDIGHKSEEQRKINSENIKKNVIDSLDQQLRQKVEQKQIKKQRQFQTDILNLQYQKNYHDNRGQNNRNFGQNQRVYEYYQRLQRQKRLKELYLDHKLVDEAAEHKKLVQDQRIRYQQLRKMMIKQDVKQTLDHQVLIHNLRRSQQSRVNPQDSSYRVISNVFRQRPSPYDKAKYVEQLKAQVQEQKQRKKMEKYMSEQEYRVNMNQLNKVVNGQYAHDTYIDRSMGTIGDGKFDRIIASSKLDRTIADGKLDRTIGDSKQLKLSDNSDPQLDRDAQSVKHRLEHLRQRNNSHVIARNDRSF